MSRPIYQIQPVDINKNQGIGILLPMNKAAHSNDDNMTAMTGQNNVIGSQYSCSGASGGSVFALSYSTEEQAISNLKNLLLTSQGERYMQPRFGTRIREAVFQQNTLQLEEFISESLTESIQQWLPYINLSNIDVERNLDQHLINIRLNFSVGTRGANTVIELLVDENTIEIINETTEQPTDLVQVGTFGGGFAGGNY